MSGSHTDRRERAFALLARLDPQAPTRVAASLDALPPELAELVLGFAFADVLARPGIDLCTREMLTVATLMGMGTAPGQLEFHIRAALNVGVSRETIIEILLQVAVYAGVPACMNGISAARSAFAAHDKGRGAGIKEETPPWRKGQVCPDEGSKKGAEAPFFHGAGRLKHLPAEDGVPSA